MSSGRAAHRYGRRRAAISYSTTPIDQMSLRRSAVAPLSCSGDIYAGVPTSLPGAVAPTVLVLGWILVPPLLGAIPSQATQYFAGDAALTAADAIALVVAVISAAVTLGVQAER